MNATVPEALFFLPSLNLGGAERHGVNVAIALDREVFVPVVVSLQDGPYRKDLEAADVEVVVLPPGSRRAPLDPRPFQAVLQARPAAVVTAQHYAVDLPLRLALLAARRSTGRRLPYVLWKHTYGHVGYRGVRERLTERTLGHVVDRYGAVCFTQLNYLRDRLDLPTDRLRVVQNSIPAQPELLPDRVRAVEFPEHGATVVCVANLRADKGLDDLIEAWRTVERQRPDARLIVVGDGPERVRLSELAAARTEGVSFLGAHPDAAELVAHADLLVLPSYNVECFPYVVLEAMRGAVPVVATATGGLAELVDDGVTGTLVPPRHPPALARALLRTLAAEESGAGLGAAGRERLLTAFPFDRWRRDVNELYLDML